MEELKKQIQEQLFKFLIWLIDTAPISMELVYNTAKTMNVFAWRALAVSQSSAAGFLFALPGVNLTIGLGADIFALFYSMAVTSYGIGAIIGSHNGYSFGSLSKSDYIDILAVWCDSPEHIKDIKAKSVLLGGIATKKTGLKVGTKAATKATFYTTSHLTSKASVKIPAKLIEKAATKIATKLGIKTGTMLTGIGSTVNAGMNAWFVNSITNAAQVYYTAKFETPEMVNQNSDDNPEINQDRNDYEIINNKFQAEDSVSFFTKFLLFCAGAKTRHIYHPKCEKDRGKYASIGATILITAVMAGLSGGYALFTVFQSPAIAAALGSFWGVTIFNLDRSFTSTTKKTKDNKNWFKQSIATGIRLSLATLVGIVIAKPFEVKVFESKINETIVRENLIKNGETRNSTIEAGRIKEINSELSQLKKEEKNKEAEWLKWENEANQEAEGRAGTGLIGKGDVYSEKKQTATQLREQLEDIKNRIATKEGKKTELERIQDGTVADIKNATKITIVDQLSTLHELAEEEDIIRWSTWAISLLLIAIEISPLLVKILAPYGEYDSLIENEENEFIDSQQKKTLSLKEDIATENRIRSIIRNKTADFIINEYLKALKTPIEDEEIEKIKKQIVSNFHHNVAKELSPKTKNISRIGLENNPAFNDSYSSTGMKNQYQEKNNFIDNQINNSGLHPKNGKRP